MIKPNKKTLKSMLIILLTSIYSVNAQSAGDIAFIAFNADSNDEFAFVTLVDIPANTSIWFTDNEWNGIDSFNNLNEGEIEWTSTSVLPAGSVVTIAGNSGGTATLVSGLGSVSGSGMNLGTSNETVYALLSKPLTTTMTSPGFLAGFSSDLLGDGVGVLTNTGLTIGIDFLDFSNDSDGFKYTGIKSGQTSFSDYLPLIMDQASWQIETNSGTSILPIDGTSFTTNIVLNTHNFNSIENELNIYISKDKKLNITSLLNEIIKIDIYTIEGQKMLTSSLKTNIPNSISVTHLNTGVYIVQLQTQRGIVAKKIMIQ